MERFGVAVFVETLFARINDGDVAAFDQLVSSGIDVLGIGTDPAEWWEGTRALVTAFTTQVSEMSAAGIRFEPREIHVSEAGDIGWFADRPRIILADGATLDTRVSGVCRREDGNWKLVQWHISVGVPNADAIGQELTIE